MSRLLRLKTSICDGLNCITKEALNYHDHEALAAGLVMLDLLRQKFNNEINIVIESAKRNRDKANEKTIFDPDTVQN